MSFPSKTVQFEYDFILALPMSVTVYTVRDKLKKTLGFDFVKGKIKKVNLKKIQTGFMFAFLYAV